MQGIKSLSLAISVNAWESFEILCKHGADLNFKDNNFMTPLHFAV